MKNSSKIRFLVLALTLTMILSLVACGKSRTSIVGTWSSDDGEERLILIPIAYMLGHLCVLGFHTLSYSEWRDAQMILAIGILFYCAMLLALSIFYSRKELRDIR